MDSKIEILVKKTIEGLVEEGKELEPVYYERGYKDGFSDCLKMFGGMVDELRKAEI
jgi:hypothetical protein